MNISVFYINLLIHYVIFLLVVWSIFIPSKRIWPPPKKKSWQYKIYWNLFYMGVILDIFLTIQEFDTWMIADKIRYFIGVPLILIGSFVVSYGIYTLGFKNTYGIEDGFTDNSPYKYTRNPQYLGDIIMILGLILLINSLNLTVLFILTIIIFILMPFAEEIWLEKKYKEKYINYKNRTSRFL